MQKLSRKQMKQIAGGIVASCSIKCKDGLFHEVNCGKDACETTLDNTVNCTSGISIVSTTDPCKNVVATATAT